MYTNLVVEKKQELSQQGLIYSRSQKFSGDINSFNSVNPYGSYLSLASFQFQEHETIT